MQDQHVLVFMDVDVEEQWRVEAQQIAGVVAVLTVALRPLLSRVAPTIRAVAAFRTNWVVQDGHSRELVQQQVVPAPYLDSYEVWLFFEPRNLS